MTCRVLQAALSSARHPECGQVTVSFPIPDNAYDDIIAQLEAQHIGDVLAQDCRVDRLDSGCSVLWRLEGTMVNVDELDYLAKRLDSFGRQEIAQFKGMAEVLQLSNIVDLINLTFSCQYVTVITDFTDLEQLGRQHRMSLNGGCLLREEWQQMDGRKEALDLLQSGKGVFTPYGLVYDNGMELKSLYDGRHFPAYLCDPFVLVLESCSTRLSLPMLDRRLNRILARGEPDCRDMRIVINDLPQRITDLLYLEREDLHALNAFCQRFQQIQQDSMEGTYCAALLAEGAGTLSEALAIDVEDYELVPVEAAGKQVLRRLGADEEIIDTMPSWAAI